jgi:hypothetical protein
MERAIASSPFAGSSAAGYRRIRLTFRSISFAPISVALGAGLWGGYAYWNRNPVIDLPAQSLPLNNMYGNYIMAASQIKNPRLLNIALGKGGMIGGTPPSLTVAGVARVYTGGKPSGMLKWQMYRTVLKENAPALQTLRAGLGMPFRVPRAEDYNFESSLIGRISELDEMLKMDADLKAKQGDWNGSMQSALDIIRVGDQVVTGSRLSQMSPLLAMTKPGYDAAMNAMNHLSSRQLCTPARVVEQSGASRNPFSDCASEQAWALLADLEYTFTQPKWRQMVEGSNAVTAWGSSSPSHVSLFTSKRAVAEDYMAYACACIAALKQPYAPTRVLPSPDNPVGAGLLAQIYNAEITYTGGGPLQDSLLATSMALRAYWLDHGRYPQRLQDLAPHYINSLPEDPFFAGHPLQYRRQDDHCWIYTLGPERNNRSVNIHGGVIYGYPAICEGSPKGTVEPTWEDLSLITAAKPMNKHVAH